MRDKISMVHGRKAPQAKGRRDANRESEQLQKRTPIRETNAEQSMHKSIRKEQREENPKTSHKNLINFFAGLHERAALPEKLPGDAKDETRRDCKSKAKRTRGEKALSKAFRAQ